MSTIRFFSGDRDVGTTKSLSNEIMRIEYQKKGRMSSTERFKLIMKNKMEESKKQLDQGKTKPLSQRAQQAIQQLNAKKAAKEAKKMRQAVIIQPRRYVNGHLTKNGNIHDIAGNVIGKVNEKDGRMATHMGFSFGRYKPKSRRTDSLIEDAINKYSPYYIQQRKLQALAAAGLDPMGRPLDQTVINVYGVQTDNSFSNYGEAAGGPRQNIGVTAWGARSDNVWGTFADNTWGSSADNVWGTNTTDVWGGIGGSPFGKGVQMWGTGNSINYLKKITSFLAGILGIRNQKTMDAFKTHRQARSAAPSATTRR